MRKTLLPVVILALAALAFFLRPTPSKPLAPPPSARPPDSLTPAAVAPPSTTEAPTDIRATARTLRAAARTDPDVLRRLIRTVLDSGRSPRDRELAACVLGSLPEPDALLALSQALSGSTDPAWTRLLLLCIGSAKDWSDDDAFSLEGHPNAVVVPLGIALTIHFVLEEDLVRRQVEEHLAGPLPKAVREAAALALRHSLKHADARSAFLTAVQAGSDFELQGLIGGPLAEWASRRPVEDVERTDILGTLLRLGSAPEADPLRFNVESGLKVARLDAREVSGILTLTAGENFDLRRWALSILSNQAARQDLPERAAVRERVTSLSTKDTDPKIREYAVAALSAFRGEDGARAALVAALRDPAWHVRARAAESLGRWPARDELAREALRQALLDENPSVRAAGESSLRGLR